MGSIHLRPAVAAVLLAAALVGGVLLFQRITGLLIALLVTILVAIPLSALADRLEVKGVPRTVSVFLGMLAALAVLGGLAALVVPQLVDQTEQLVDRIPSDFNEIGDRLGGIGGDTVQVGDRVQSFLEDLASNPGSLIGSLASLGLSVLGALGILVLILITAAFMAISPEPLIRGALSLLPPARREWGHQTMLKLRGAWIGWMQGVGIDMLTTGTLTYVGLSLVDLDFALVFAVLSGLLVVVPYFGAIVGGIPPVLVALADSPGKALVVLLIYTGIQQLEANVIVPLVMADRADLHPAMVAIGVVIVGQLFGFVGLFVAVPILSLVIVLTQELWVKPLEDASLEGASEPEPAGRDP